MNTPTKSPEATEQSFDGFLCRAWGESDKPCAQVMPDLAGVRHFLIREWLGSEDDTGADGELTLPRVMDEITGWNWEADEQWSAEFEIGGVSVEPVYSFAAPPPPVGELQGVTEQSFEGFLCRAWGETDLPCAEVVRDWDGVSRFMVREWLGGEDAVDADGTPTLQRVMYELKNREWGEDGDWLARFEIGGVSVEPVYGFAASRALPANMGYEPDGPVGMALSWLKSALTCKAFIWDGDQHEYATKSLEDSEKWLAELLAATPPSAALTPVVAAPQAAVDARRVPIPYISYDVGKPELWIGYMDAQGCYTPIAGPDPVPKSWLAAVRPATGEGETS